MPNDKPNNVCDDEIVRNRDRQGAPLWESVIAICGASGHSKMIRPKEISVKTNEDSWETVALSGQTTEASKLTQALAPTLRFVT